MKAEERGKISEDFQGLGTVTREMVERRARELAIINGRAPNEFTEADWSEARREMLGEEDSEIAREDEETVAALKTWDEPPGTTGHEVGSKPAPDEQTFSEQLVQEGLDEANHDKMLQGSLDDENQS
jgi:hypothetical protein